MSLLHLVYYSRASANITEQMLKEMLDISTQNNLRDEITGFLIFRDGFFVQLLEGIEDRVRTCLGRIQRDTRHNFVTVIAQVKSDTRMMPHWGMSLIDNSQLTASTKDLINLFDSTVVGEIHSTKKSIELILRKFAEQASGSAKLF